MRRILHIGIALALMLMPLVAHAASSEVKELRYWSGPEYTRVVIELDSLVDFSINRLGSPDRIYIDVNGSVLPSSVKSELRVNDGLIGSIRAGQYQASTVRVVMDMADQVEYNVFRLSAPERVVLDVYKPVAKDFSPKPAGQKIDVVQAAIETTVRPVAPTTIQSGNAGGNIDPRSLELIRKRVRELAKIKATDAPKEEPAESPVEPAAAPVVGSASIVSPAHTPASEPERPSAVAKAEPLTNKTKVLSVRGTNEANAFKRYKVVIDAGHGGKDPGAIAYGLEEKDIVLDIAKRINEELGRRNDVEIILTRSTDVFLELSERTDIANQRDADLFVSIHANASRNTRARGLETYVLNWTDDDESMKVAARENQISPQKMYEAQSEIGIMLASLSLQSKRDYSLDLARDIQDSLYASVANHYKGTSDNGVKQALFYVLFGAKMPSVLVEVSYLTNESEARRIKSSTYRTYIAKGVANGITKFLSQPDNLPQRIAKR